MSTEDRKIEVGEVYRLPDATVFDVHGGGVYVNFGEGGRRFPRDWFAAHATLVKRAERPLAVGEKVTWGARSNPHERWTILAIDDGRAWIKHCTRSVHQSAVLTDLRRAETP